MHHHNLREYSDWLLQLAREPQRSERDRSGLMRERQLALEVMCMTEPAELRQEMDELRRWIEDELPRAMAELEQWLRDELRRLNE